MKRQSLLWWIVLSIGALTIVSGLVQVLAPAFVLKIISAQITPTSSHFFSIVGMFMVLFGGLMLHALCNPVKNSVAILWASLQKFGASAAVGLGVCHHIFSPLALLIAGFDLCSGILGIWYLQEVKKRMQPTFEFN
jgi:uncharacterized protein YjeT (DUF2065 family)